MENNKCPWCKIGKYLSVECFDDDDSAWAVYCSKCKMTGPLVIIDELDTMNAEKEGELEAYIEKRVWDLFSNH